MKDAELQQLSHADAHTIHDNPSLSCPSFPNTSISTLWYLEDVSKVLRHWALLSEERPEFSLTVTEVVTVKIRVNFKKMFMSDHTGSKQNSSFH